MSIERDIIRLIKAHRTFLVTMHINPDPDALGAALAMALFLRSIGKKVRLVNDGPCPGWLKFMPHSNLIEVLEGDKPGPGGRAGTCPLSFSPEVIIVLDSGDVQRIGRVAAFIKPGVTVVNIDHHVTNRRFGDHDLVQPQSSSASEIVYEFLKAARFKLTRDMATLLYLGILTDTGSFGFDCTSVRTHEIIADLLKFGLPVSELYRQVYATMPREDLKAFLALMNTLSLHHGQRVACLTITKKQAAKFSDNFDLKDKVFGFLRSVDGLEVIMILTEQEKKKTRINLRSRGHVDVAAFASRFSGGGHKKASGGFVDMPLARGRALVLSRIVEVL